MTSPIIKEERIGGQRLILGDCLQVMPLLGKVDAVVTDPPYGIGKDGQRKTTGKNGGRKAYSFKGWDDQRPSKKTFDTIFSLSGNLIIWGGNYFADFLPAAGKWLVWDKGQRIYQSDGELAYTSFNGALRIFTQNRAALLTDGAVHPTQKPVALMQWCLGFVPNAKTVLDPFMGSGTTLVACQKMGRAGIGIELDPEYFRIACDRVQKAFDQPDMFVDPVPLPTQQGLDI